MNSRLRISGVSPHYLSGRRVRQLLVWRGTFPLSGSTVKSVRNYPQNVRELSSMPPAPNTVWSRPLCILHGLGAEQATWQIWQKDCPSDSYKERCRAESESRTKSWIFSRLS